MSSLIYSIAIATGLFVIFFAFTYFPPFRRKCLDKLARIKKISKLIYTNVTSPRVLIVVNSNTEATMEAKKELV
jgi:hypothetical protein